MLLYIIPACDCEYHLIDTHKSHTGIIYNSYVIMSMITKRLCNQITRYYDYNCFA